jgi:hypothetical protein
LRAQSQVSKHAKLGKKTACLARNNWLPKPNRNLSSTTKRQTHHVREDKHITVGTIYLSQKSKCGVAQLFPSHNSMPFSVCIERENFGFRERERERSKQKKLQERKKETRTDESHKT